MPLAPHIVKQINADLPEGWERSGATHCTHAETHACVWYSQGLGWWAAPRDAVGNPYEKWELRGGYNTRDEAMVAAVKLHEVGGRYVE